MYQNNEYKQRVNFQVGKSIELKDDEMGSYMMFYMIGPKVGQLVEHTVKTVSNGIFDKNCIDLLKKMDIHFVVKAGTTANRKSVRPIDPFSIRGREILNELGKCFQGVTEGADRATQTAHKILASNNTYECQAIMVAHKTHSKYDYTTMIEEEVNDYVKDTYGIEVSNVAKTFAPRSTERWGINKINIKF